MKMKKDGIAVFVKKMEKDGMAVFVFNCIYGASTLVLVWVVHKFPLNY
jgi:hypothetical protein